MTKTTAEKTKYPGVYRDSRGHYFYQAYLGRDPITGKKVTKKMPPDLSAIKILLSLNNNFVEYEKMSDEELEKEKTKLLDLIAKMDNKE